MPSMNMKNFGLSGVATTDLGLGSELQTQTEEQILEQNKKKKKGQAASSLSGMAGMDLLGTANNGAA
jgi:hypothetical protein